MIKVYLCGGNLLEISILKFNIQTMWSKDEAKELRLNFWKGFKRYCSRHQVDRKWVLTGVKIKSTQLKFYIDGQKALVLFQIDHKSDLRRYEIYECFQAYRKLMAVDCGEDLKWEEDFNEIGERPISAIYFELQDVNILCKDDWEKIHKFYAEKMPLLEDAYWEYRDVITESLKASF